MKTVNFFIFLKKQFFINDENAENPPSPSYLTKRRNALKLENSNFIEEEEINDELSGDTVNPQENEPSPISLQQAQNFNDNEEKGYKTWQDKMRFYSRFYLPHIGLFCLAAAYILIGAAYFYYHESAFEAESKSQALSEFAAFREEFYHRIFVLSHSNNTDISHENFQQTQQKLFDDFVTHIFRFKNNQYITQNHLLNEPQNETELLWSFSNSVFFSTILLTTIGYTNKLAPATIYGKIGCVIYALFGIPLIIITVSGIGKLQYEILIWSYNEGRRLKDNLIRTIRKPISRFFSINETELFPTKSECNPKNHVCTECVHLKNSHAVYDDQKLPFALILTMVIAYFVITGFLLSIWKGWSFMDSIFICYTTMTTIGFGNELPAKNDSIFFLIICILFGAAFTKVFFEITGIQYARKIHYYGRKSFFGIKRLKKVFQRKNTEEMEHL